MGEADSVGTQRSWRKRHPLLSRVLLYALVVIAASVAAWFWMDGRNRRLRAELVTLDVLAAQDSDGQAVLRVLDEDFSGLFLPRDVVRDVHRLRAFSHAKGGSIALAQQEFDAALTLAEDPVIRGAIQVDRVYVRTWCGDAAGALADLEAGDLPRGSATLDLAVAAAHAYALAGGERADEAGAVLEAALDAAPRPLPDEGALWVGGSPYTSVEAARLATQALDELTPGGAPSVAWDRLLALAPADFTAAVDATRALIARKRRVDAVRFWEVAGRLDPRLAGEMAARDPELQRLQDFLNTSPDR